MERTFDPRYKGDHPWFDYTEWYCANCEGIVEVRQRYEKDEYVCAECGEEVELVT